MPPHLADLSADLDALYRAPLPEFIARRNTLAARVRTEQGKEAGDAIKALAKPSGTAWVVNQVFWRHRKDFDRLMAAGDRLRDVQQQRLAGDDEADMRAAMEERQAALSVVMARVPDLLAEAGLSASQPMRTRVSTTLEALSIYGGRDPAPRAGRLVEDVDPPGFSALAALVPMMPDTHAGRGPASGSRGAAPAVHGKRATSSSPKAEAAEGEDAAARTAKPGGRTTPAPPKLRAVDLKRVTAAKSALDAAKAAATDAQAAAHEAEAARTKAEVAWQEAKAALDEVQKRLDEAMDRERDAQQARDEARKAAVTARQALDRAERTRDQAERAYHAARGAHD